MSKTCNILSFDQDWAPDFMCESIADILIEKKVKSTWFITNDSPLLKKLRSYKNLFEIGIHPNFLPNSSHGSTVENVLDTITTIVPEAICSRSHAVYQYGGLLQMLRTSYNIKWDLTMFEYEKENISPVKLLTSEDNYLWRLPVFWCDDHEFNNPDRKWNFNKYLSIKGIKVFSFHPIHVYLNSDSNANYTNYKAKASGQILNKEQLDPLINKGLGSGSFFRELIEEMSDKPCYFISELKND